MILILLFVLLVVSIYMDNAVLGMVSIISIVGYVMYLIVAKIRKLLKKKEPEKPKAAKEIHIKVNVSTDPYFCKIAGVQYRNDVRDIGGFLGYVCSELTNKYDKNAIGIYRNDDKLLGYIPKDEIADFRKWSEKENLPCIGFIKDGDEVTLHGKVKVIDGDKDETELEIVKFVKWLISKFGVKFIPVGFNVDVDEKPRTKKEWLDFLSNYIDEKECELYEEE